MGKILRIGFVSCQVFGICIGVAQAAQSTLVVVDSTGKEVGAVAAEHVVVFKAKPGLDIVQMRVDGSRLGRETAEYYTTPKCAGAVYVRSNPLLRNGYLKKGDPGTIIYANTSAALTAVRSYIPEGSTVCGTVPQGVMAYPAIKTRMDQQGFTPPFSTKLQ